MENNSPAAADKSTTVKPYRFCGRRTARFMCTLPAGHSGPHGRLYRRVSQAEADVIIGLASGEKA